MKRIVTMLLAVLLVYSLTNTTAFAAKKKEVTSVGAIYEIDSWLGATYELFLKEYELKMPRKIKLNFTSSDSEFYSFAKIKADVGAITIEGTIIVSGGQVTSKNRTALLKELIRLTLMENNKAKDADKIIRNFFEKHKIK
ncbi:MAG: hypothetical protein N2Z58_08065 [Fervidobacterium sp.]|nr:hypothetical protein [Fervidobacterium sp.]